MVQDAKWDLILTIIIQTHYLEVLPDLLLCVTYSELFSKYDQEWQLIPGDGTGAEVPQTVAQEVNLVSKCDRFNTTIRSLILLYIIQGIGDDIWGKIKRIIYTRCTYTYNIKQTFFEIFLMLKQLKLVSQLNPFLSSKVSGYFVGFY